MVHCHSPLVSHYHAKLELLRLSTNRTQAKCKPDRHLFCPIVYVTLGFVEDLTWEVSTIHSCKRNRRFNGNFTLFQCPRIGKVNDLSMALTLLVHGSTGPTTSPQMKGNKMKIHWLNRELNWRIEERDGGFWLYNGFGFTGRYDTLRSALQADAQMNQEPFEA